MIQKNFLPYFLIVLGCLLIIGVTFVILNDFHPMRKKNYSNDVLVCVEANEKNSETIFRVDQFLKNFPNILLIFKSSIAADSFANEYPHSPKVSSRVLVFNSEGTTTLKLVSSLVRDEDKKKFIYFDKYTTVIKKLPEFTLMHHIRVFAPKTFLVDLSDFGEVKADNDIVLCTLAKKQFVDATEKYVCKLTSTDVTNDSKVQQEVIDKKIFGKTCLSFDTNLFKDRFHLLHYISLSLMPKEQAASRSSVFTPRAAAQTLGRVMENMTE